MVAEDELARSDEIGDACVGKAKLITAVAAARRSKLPVEVCETIVATVRPIPAVCLVVVTVAVVMHVVLL
jgi:hypothetical protein